MNIRLFIDHFIQQKWFTQQQLNNRIGAFPYTIEDRQDKPCTLFPKSDIITGGACQIWNFLRLLPLLIKNKVDDIENKVWLCLLLLTEIIEIVSASSIHTSTLFG